jgi:AbrB family looped-hinge helix DNA binding protein
VARSPGSPLKKTILFLVDLVGIFSRKWQFFLAGKTMPSYVLTGKRLKLGELTVAPGATTKMSSKGQVVIPEGIRKRLGLKSDSQFVVVGEKDVVILKVVSPPSMKEFDALVAEARKQARQWA